MRIFTDEVRKIFRTKYVLTQQILQILFHKPDVYKSQTHCKKTQFRDIGTLTKFRLRGRSFRPCSIKVKINIGCNGFFF